jgi:hypothetical protein
MPDEVTWIACAANHRSLIRTFVARTHTPQPSGPSSRGARSHARHRLAGEEHSLGESPAPKRVPGSDLRLKLAQVTGTTSTGTGASRKAPEVLDDAVNPAVVAVALQEHQNVCAAPPPEVTPSNRSEKEDRLDLGVGAPQRLRQPPERCQDRIAVKKPQWGEQVGGPKTKRGPEQRRGPCARAARYSRGASGEKQRGAREPKAVAVPKDECPESENGVDRGAAIVDAAGLVEVSNRKG